MTAVETSFMVLLFIFGFGLCGASYNTCKDTLSSNGFNLTDSQYQSFYEAANDPVNINYINANESSFAATWEEAAEQQEEGDLYDWYRSHITMSGNNDPSGGNDEKPSYWVPPTSVDETFKNAHTDSSGKWVENSSSSSSVSFSKQDIENMFFQQYGKVGKVITDGHDGYYIGEFVPSDGSPSSPGTYQVVHHYADGHSVVIQQIGLPYLNKEVRNGYAAFYVDYTVVENEDGSQTVTAYRFTKQVNPDLPSGFSVNESSYPFVVRFSDKATSDIEEEKGDEITFPLNPDGTVTLPDGTVLVPNEDGSFTIGGTKYYPKKDVVSPNDLLKQLLELQKRLEELENELKFEKEKEKDQELDEEIDEAAEQYDGDLMEFVLNSKLTQVFPFCLPFDLVRGIKLFSASPVTPVFEFPINIPEFGLFPGVKTSIVLDFKKFETIAVLCRWMSTMSFIFGLITVTFKVVKGSGS